MSSKMATVLNYLSLFRIVVLGVVTALPSTVEESVCVCVFSVFEVSFFFWPTKHPEGSAVGSHS